MSDHQRESQVEPIAPDGQLEGFAWCGAILGDRACILDKGHEGRHGWDTDTMSQAERWWLCGNGHLFLFDAQFTGDQGDAVPAMCSVRWPDGEPCHDSTSLYPLTTETAPLFNPRALLSQAERDGLAMARLPADTGWTIYRYLDGRWRVHISGRRSQDDLHATIADAVAAALGEPT